MVLIYKCAWKSVWHTGNNSTENYPAQVKYRCIESKHKWSIEQSYSLISLKPATMNNVLLRGTRKWVSQRREIEHSTMARLDRKKMEPFLCEAPALSVLAEIWHSTGGGGSFTIAACDAFECLRYVSTYWWPLLRHDRSKKRSLLEPRPSHSRQKQIRWDILCQLQSVLNPCEWAFRKSAIIKVLLNFPWMGFHPAEIRWHQTGGAALQEAMSQMTRLLVWFKVLFCAVSVCDKLRPELYNTSMIPALI